MTTIRIVKSRRIPSALPGRIGLLDTIIIFTAGDNPLTMYAVSIPSENPTDGEIAATAGAELALAETHEGKTITI